MNRNQAKELLPIIQAYAEGKTIQSYDSLIDIGDWEDCENPKFEDSNYNYRIKPEQKYRAFKDAEECWQEMLKHKPFGWVKDEEDCRSVLITVCENDGVFMGRNEGWNFKDTLDLFTFVDGTPFGVKVEE